jgi:hypothetical protein
MDILLLFLVFASGMILGLSYGAFENYKVRKLTIKVKFLTQELYNERCKLGTCRDSLARIQAKLQAKQAATKVGTTPKAVVMPSNPPKVKVAPPSRRVVREDEDSSILLGVTAVAAGMAIANSFDDSPAPDFSNVSSGGGGDFAGGGASEEY